MNTNNAFRKVLNVMALNGDMQDNGSDAAFVLLSAMADNADYLIAHSAYTDDVYANQFDEVLHRLLKYRGYGLRRLAHLFSDYGTVSVVIH